LGTSTGAGVGAGGSVGAAVEVGSGFPPHAARITASRSTVPRSNKLFFIDIYDILLSMGFVQRGISSLRRQHLLKILRVFESF
jgi:hypothetical protein